MNGIACNDIKAVEMQREAQIRASQNQEPNYEELKKVWMSTNYGYEYYDAKNEAMKKQQNYIENDAKKLLDEMKTNSDKTYLWENAKEVKTNSSHMTKSYKNIERIAEAIEHPKSTLKTDENINKLKDAIKWMHEHVYGQQAEDNVRSLISNFKETKSAKKKAINWWDYEIGSPKALTNTLILMDNELTFEEKKTYVAPIKTYVPKSDEILASIGKPERATGGNLVDISKVKLTESIIVEDKNLMKSSIDAFNNVFVYVKDNASGKERNGFFKDGSYIDHQDVPYTGAYGVILLEGVSQLLPIIKATPYKVNDEHIQVLDQWIDQAFIPLFHKGELMDFVRGRAVSREAETSHSTAVTVIKSLLRISEAMNNQELKYKYRQFIKTSVLSDKSYSQNDHLTSYADIHKMKYLIDDASITVKNKAQQLKIYDGMKRMVYHNPNLNFTLGLSLTSKGVARYESINNENLKGWHTGAGMYYLYNNDVQHYRDHYWPTVNMKHLAGTTTLNDEPTGNKKSEKTFVGGAKLNDKFASIGMDFENQQQTLSAKKSWFILDDKIVFVGSGINNNDAQTTIENRKAKGYTLYNDDHVLENVQNKETKSLFLETQDKQNNIGYHFIKPTNLNIDKIERTGKWRDINQGQSDKEYKQSYYEISQPHTHVNHQYAYVLYPGIERSEFNNKKNDVSMVKLENQFHVVKDNVNHVWGIVNYENQPQTFEIDGTKINIKAKCIFVLKKQDDHTFEGTYHHPEEAISNMDIQSKISIEGYKSSVKHFEKNNNKELHFECKKQ